MQVSTFVHDEHAKQLGKVSQQCAHTHTRTGRQRDGTTDFYCYANDYNE